LIAQLVDQTIILRSNDVSLEFHKDFFFIRYKVFRTAENFIVSIFRLKHVIEALLFFH